MTHNRIFYTRKTNKVISTSNVVQMHCKEKDFMRQSFANNAKTCRRITESSSSMEVCMILIVSSLECSIVSLSLYLLDPSITGRLRLLSSEPMLSWCLFAALRFHVQGSRVNSMCSSVGISHH